MRLLSLLLGATALLLLSLGASAQQGADTLYLSEYLQQVSQHHPLARAARLMEEQGRMEVRAARGFFDPELGGTFDEKRYKDRTYYRIFSSDLKVNTRLGLDLKAGYDYAQGYYLNPERTVPDDGLWYAGVSLPLAQGLFFDEGRAALRAARIRQQRFQWEQRQQLANLLYEATVAYWTWAGHRQQVQTLQNALQVARQRYQLVQGGFATEELPAIDTLEAFVQLQTLQSQLLEEEQALIKAEQEVASFYWSEEGTPLWQSQFTPSPLPPASLPDSLYGTASPAPLALAEGSPALRYYGFRLEELEADRRWKAEKLKPSLQASYNLLSSEPPLEGASSYSVNNYKFGVNFKMPLLLRNARGELQLSRLKLEATALEQRQKRLELTTKLEALLGSLELLQQQVQQNQQLAEGYRRLWQAEQQKFEFGESTLFYVNARELKYLESRLKLFSLQVKFQQQQAELKRMLGLWEL
ncbi:TolC family protein [Cesiribacter andamanensis]|nr:TolC family protein [Cesiribacter andamanensis]